MSPFMAAIAAACLLGHRLPGRVLLLDRPLFKFGAIAMGAGELVGDKLESAPDRTVAQGKSGKCRDCRCSACSLGS